ncbi:hypothetical protein BgAZ_202000 [Babesia gibsoni]|uniref:Glutaredoxin domain-containing protein n=1 Tax=Babesia gibsoni TaxID=33632 RepID=A0AAD8LJD8_BABGI|nr:hypothetical protein BgAZ_202000 [Babesia gibsoni]
MKHPGQDSKGFFQYVNRFIFGLKRHAAIADCHTASGTKVETPAKSCGTTACAPKDAKTFKLTPEAEARIVKEISQYDVVLFMKGNASRPACKYSRRALDILKASKAPLIRTVNVLEDQSLRDGIKKYSNYPYIPQLYVRRTFIGGVDKMEEMHGKGSLQKILQG